MSYAGGGTLTAAKLVSLCGQNTVKSAATRANRDLLRLARTIRVRFLLQTTIGETVTSAKEER